MCSGLHIRPGAAKPGGLINSNPELIPEKKWALTSRELQIHCLHRLADYQQPLAYEFVEDFPRTELGKVIKHKLVEQRQRYDLTQNLRAALKNN